MFKIDRFLLEGYIFASKDETKKICDALNNKEISFD